MIQEVNTALMELQSALLARSLYPEGHPRIRSGEERALERLRAILERKAEVTLFSVDNRVIFNNEVLPSSENLTESLFRALNANGIDRLTLRRGIDATELRRFLDSLSGVIAQKEGQALTASQHLTFGALSDIDVAEYEARGNDTPADPRSLEASGSAADAFGDVWDKIEPGDDRFDTGVLRDIVASISQVISDSSGAVLPLARLKSHDEYTFVHTINVAMLSCALAEALGFEDRHVHDVTIAALLHDVGKRAIPDAVLNKAGKFTDDEFRIMKAHPVEGARMLLNASDVPEIAPIVAFEHHVRADGSGYPRVPKGWKLSLASRIVQLADVFDALRTDRPYRPGQSVGKIIDIMRQDVGSFFDADLLMIFVQEVVSQGVPSGSGTTRS